MQHKGRSRRVTQGDFTWRPIASRAGNIAFCLSSQKGNISPGNARWADLYYIPREYFDDFIVLAGVFLKHEVHHETAVPAIMLILASSRHPELLAALAKDECPSPSIFTSHGSLSLIDDCWGHCCSYGIAADEIAKYRCGHHLDLHSIDHVKAFIKTI